MTSLEINCIFMTHGTPYIYSGTSYSNLHFCDFPLSIHDQPFAQLFVSETTRKLSSTAKLPMMFLSLFLQWHVQDVPEVKVNILGFNSRADSHSKRHIHMCPIRIGSGVMSF